MAVGGGKLRKRVKQPKQARARKPASATAADRIARALEAWFGTDGVARQLPWRDRPAGERDPYVVLVAETMLQQTQVSRIAERLPRFLSRFPTLADLAAADLDDVLAEWSGLGYYRRARSLHAAARLAVERHNGELPRGIDALRELPGVGRYTAGAIASLAFNAPAPIVDGNVSRVLLRVHGRSAASDDRSVQLWLWDQAGRIASSTDRPGLVNEAMMELGATVCLPAPAEPACERCPLAGLCRARADGTQMRIPLPKSAAKRKAVYAASVVITREDGAMLLEQRPARGMWAGMWQAITIERADRHADTGELAAELAVSVGINVRSLTRTGGFLHKTTHRDVHFEVWNARITQSGRERIACGKPTRGEWISPARAATLALSNAQRRILFPDAGLFSSTPR